MELNSLLLLLEAAEYLERRDRGSPRAFVHGWAAGGGWRVRAADRAVCPQRPSTATPRCCPSTATSPGRKQRRPAWCARPRTTGTAPAPPSRRGPAVPPAPAPPCAPAAGLEEAPRPRPPRPRVAIFPRPRLRRCKQCHAYSAHARPGALPTSPGGGCVVNGRGPGSWARERVGPARWPRAPSPAPSPVPPFVLLPGARTKTPPCAHRPAQPRTVEHQPRVQGSPLWARAFSGARGRGRLQGP